MNHLQLLAEGDAYAHIDLFILFILAGLAVIAVIPPLIFYGIYDTRRVKLASPQITSKPLSKGFKFYRWFTALSIDIYAALLIFAAPAVVFNYFEPAAKYLNYFQQWAILMIVYRILMRYIAKNTIGERIVKLPSRSTQEYAKATINDIVALVAIQVLIAIAPVLV